MTEPTQPQRSLRSRRSSEVLCATIVLDRELVQAQCNINQLRRNKTVLAIFGELTERFRRSEERYIITVRTEDVGTSIYIKPTRAWIFDGRVTFAPGESVVYRWVTKIEKTRVCLYSNQLTDSCSSIKARLLLHGCSYYPRKDSPIHL